jgi:hypothetical protein
VLLVNDVVIIPGSMSQSRMPGFPSHAQSLGGSRRKVWHKCQTSASFPRTRALLEQRGFESPASPGSRRAALWRVRTIDLSELQKAEAGVTCTSLILNHEAMTTEASAGVRAKSLKC